MRRFTLILAVLGMLCLTGATAQAGGYHHHYGHYRGPWGGYHGPVAVRSPAWVAPRVVVPPPVVVAVPRPRCYYAEPGYGFYYRGRGVSVSVGF